MERSIQNERNHQELQDRNGSLSCLLWGMSKHHNAKVGKETKKYAGTHEMAAVHAYQSDMHDKYED
jgi:3-methyladenine DNA glycosylase Tag